MPALCCKAFCRVINFLVLWSFCLSVATRPKHVLRRMMDQLAGVVYRIHRLHLCRRVTLPQRVSCRPVGWCSRIHQLYFCRRIRPPSECPVAQSAGTAEYNDCISLNECHGYDTKQSDGKFPLMTELYWVQSTLSLPSLLAPIWTEVLAPDRVLSMGQIELKCALMLI